MSDLKRCIYMLLTQSAHCSSLTVHLHCKQHLLKLMLDLWASRDLIYAGGKFLIKWLLKVLQGLWCWSWTTTPLVDSLIRSVRNHSAISSSSLNISEESLSLTHLRWMNLKGTTQHLSVGRDEWHKAVHQQEQKVFYSKKTCWQNSWRSNHVEIINFCTQFIEYYKFLY